MCVFVCVCVFQEACVRMEEGIHMERHCAQLVEQHGAAQDWLREHVKGLGPQPTDRQALHSYANTLKVSYRSMEKSMKEQHCIAMKHAICY